MERTIRIGDKEVTLRATAAVPYLYREEFGQDMLLDMAETSSGSNTALFTRLAYIMARHADKSQTPENIIDWLDQFETFDIYQAGPAIMEVWGLNQQTTAKSKKKQTDYASLYHRAVYAAVRADRPVRRRSGKAVAWYGVRHDDGIQQRRCAIPLHRDARGYG